MAAIKLEQFGGMLPAWDAHLLPVGQATLARNAYLFSGTLQGWRIPKVLRALTNPAARSVYRIPTVSQSQAIAYLALKTVPNAGDTVVVGEQTYTFKASLAAPFDVLIAADTYTQAQYLIEAVTADSGQNTNAGVHYGADTPLNGDVKYYKPDADPQQGLTAPQVVVSSIGGSDYSLVVLGATDFGSAYNTIKVAESTSAARLTWLYDADDFTHTTSTLLGGSNPTFNTAVTAASAWLEFNDPDTDVFRSPVADDQWKRYYFASPSQPPKYNTYDRIVNGDAHWLLGVPAPGCAVTLDVTGGGNNVQMGNTPAGTGFFNGSANTVYVTKITTTGGTQLTQVSFTADPDQMPADVGLPDARFAAVLYDDNGGIPGTLLNTGAITTGVSATGASVSAFVNPAGLNPVTSYWIGVIVDSVIPFLRGPAGVTVTNTVSWPDTFTNGPSQNAPTSTLASVTLTSTNTNVVNGDRVAIGTRTYTFQTTLTNVNGNVHIGASADASLANLEHAINASGGTPGTDYAVVTVAHPTVSAGAVAAHAIVITALLTSTVGSSVTTTFLPAGSPVTLSFNSPYLVTGYSSGQPGLAMFGDLITSDVIESRAYVYTWVSEYGEEGPPSPPTLLDGWSNGIWTLGLWTPPPDDTGVLRNLKKVNIYRTVSGAGGSTVFFFVDTVDIGVDLFVDTKGDDVVALNDQLTSTNWFPPPTNLLGFTVLQNGMVAGFTNNEVWFCEPYHPHAWPPGYVLTVDFPIVGMGVTNGALVVCTAAVPYVISGNAPSSMGQIKCSEANPCSSRASILGGATAVSYMSNNGLIQVTSAGIATNTTDLWFTREKWQQLTPQRYGRAIYLASCYYCMGSVSPDGTDTSLAQTGFFIALDQDNTSFTIWPQPGGHRIGFGPLDSPTSANVQNVFTDPWTGTGMFVSNGSVWYMDFTDPVPQRMAYTWRSKLYQQNAKRNYSAMKVFFTVPQTVAALNAERIEEVADSAAWVLPLPADRYGYIRTYVDVDGTGDMTLIDQREIRKPGEILRIIDGFKAEHWQWEIVGRVVVSNVQIATSPKELAQV